MFVKFIVYKLKIMLRHFTGLIYHCYKFIKLLICNYYINYIIQHYTVLNLWLIFSYYNFIIHHLIWFNFLIQLITMHQFHFHRLYSPYHIFTLHWQTINMAYGRADGRILYPLKNSSVRGKGRARTRLTIRSGLVGLCYQQFNAFISISICFYLICLFVFR